MEEVVIASSSTDAGISSWDLHSGAEHLHHRSCASVPHGLATVGGRFLVSSQVRTSNSTSGSIFLWSWNKPQVEVKSFPAEPLNPLASNSEGTYIVGGGLSGYIYLWEVATGRLLKKWHAHTGAVTCLIFSDDQLLLISGAEDGCVRVWSLLMIFDDVRREEASYIYQYSFLEHTLRVTDIVAGYGGCSSIIVSASEDKTCKVWSLSSGELLRNIVFPSEIDALALDPGEHFFYAGGKDGKIYIAALNSLADSSGDYGLHIVDTLPEHSKAITCLAFSMNGIQLVSGSVDGMVRVWNTRTRNIVHILKHPKGPINNILVIRRPVYLNPPVLLNSQAPSVRRPASLLPPPLEKYANSINQNADIKVVIAPQAISNVFPDTSYISDQTMDNQIKELQQQGSHAVAEIEIERLKLDLQTSMQMAQQWKQMFENLHQFCTNEFLDRDST